jgi:hypothetical protein
MPAIYSWHFAGKARGGGAAGGGSFTPPYDLPTSGNVVAIGVTGATSGSFYSTRPTSGVNGEMTGANFAYAVFNCYGAGDVLEDYSEGGAYVVCQSGGHGCPANVGASIFDFTDAQFKRKDPHTSHGGTDYYRTTDYSPAETSGSPLYEITGSAGIPTPAHIQTQQLRVPSSVDGSTLGSMIQVGRCAVTSNSGVNSGWAYKFDMSTGLYDQISTNAASNTQIHASAVFDEARNRYWFCSGEQNIENSVQYLDCSDWTFKTTATHTIVYNGHDQGSLFMYEGLLCRFGTDLDIYVFDPDDAATGWILPGGGATGTPPTDRLNRWAYFPSSDKFYYRGSTNSDAVLHRLTPGANPKTNAWAFDTVTLGSSLPRSTLDGDPGDQASHYGCLVYVPSIQRLAWIPGGDEQVYLIHPGS